MSPNSSSDPHGLSPDATQRWDAAFAADLHLRPGDPGGLRRAVDLVERCLQRTRRLVLLGDVFDVWISAAMFELHEMDALFESFRRATAAGLEVHFLPGNRDFLFTPEDGAALGIEVHDEEWDLLVGGRDLRLLHGDQLLTRDLAYQRFKRCVRSRPVRAFARRFPRRWCLSLARRLRQYSDQAIAGKSVHELGVVDEAVWTRLQGADAVLCGHVHRAIRRRWAQGELLVLPPFCDRGESVVLVGSEFFVCDSSGHSERFALEVNTEGTMEGTEEPGASPGAAG